MVWCVWLALVSFVSQDIKFDQRPLDSLRRFSGRKRTLKLVGSWEHCVPGKLLPALESYLCRN